jgi:superfamily II DNA/RNA helicase
MFDDEIISIQGEQPDDAPNPSACARFRALYPSLFAPLQTETFDRVRAERNLALVAPTSSGKTLAVAAPLFEAQRKVVFVYPYRAVVLDQTSQLVRYGEPFGLKKDDFVQVVGGTPERALGLAVGKKYILMTPDKLVSLFLGGRTPRGAALTILTNYVFVFDEIHVYNSLMLASLVYFIRSVKYWREGVGGKLPAFYFLSATFSEELWLLLKEEVGMNNDDRIEGKSKTGDVTLILRPGKDNPDEIVGDMVQLGMVTDVVGIFNTAFKAWQVSEKLWGRDLARHRLFVGQDKMSERERVDNFRAFTSNPQAGGLCGSPAIEAGVDFGAGNVVIEESYADNFLQRFGRAARSGQKARVLCYSSALYSRQTTGQLKTMYTRREFLEMLRQLLPTREPRALLTGLAAYPYFKFWDGPGFIEGEAELLCRKLEEKDVPPLLAFRGFTPYAEYSSGEHISYRTLFKKDLRVEDGEVVGAPSLERYFLSKRRSPVTAKLGPNHIGHAEKLDEETTILLAKVSFEGFGTHWVVLEIKSAEYERNHPREEDDNICLRGLPSGEAGRISEAGVRNGIVRFYDIDA